MTKYIPTPLMGNEFNFDAHSKDVIKTAQEKEMAKALELPTDDPVDPKRMKRVEYTWTEMQAQPEIIRDTTAKERESIKASAAYFAQKGIDRIIMVGCGDSITSMEGVRYAYESLLKIQVETQQALNFAYYYHGFVNEKTLVIALSSSGATTRVVEAMMVARQCGAQTLCLSNTPGSTLMVECDRGILIHAERKGWPTQSSTAAMATLLQFLIDFADASGIDPEKVKHYQETLDSLPALMRKALDVSDKKIHEIAIKERDRKFYLFAGGGPCYSAAVFGSAKVKECSPDQALTMQMEEFHHYNSLKVGDPIIIVAPDGYSVSRAFDTANESRRWGGQVYVIVTEGNHAFDEVADEVIYLPAIDEQFSAMVYSMPTQLFGYYVAMEKYQKALKDLGKEA